jgi:hypothetical protein
VCSIFDENFQDGFLGFHYIDKNSILFSQTLIVDKRTVQQIATSTYLSTHDSSHQTPPTMPAVACPIPDCEYVTDDLDSAIIAALITADCNAIHSAAGPSATTAKVEKVRRPTIAAAGTSEDWAYILK